MKLASATALAVTIFLAAPLAAYVVDRRAGDDGVSPPRDAPPAAAGWSGPVETADDWSPHFESPEEENRKAYWHGANRVELYAASYRHERQGSELINSKNRVYDPESWRRVGERVREIRVNARRFRVIQTDLLHPSPAGAQRRLAWHWYVVAGEPMTDPILAKFAEAKARLLGLREGSAAVVVAADYKDSQNDAARLLEEFLRAHGPALQAAFTKGADRARP